MTMSARTSDKEDGGDGGRLDKPIAHDLKGGRKVRVAASGGLAHRFDGGADLGAVASQRQQQSGDAVAKEENMIGRERNDSNVVEGCAMDNLRQRNGWWPLKC